MEGAYQEKEGPAISRSILEKIGYDPDKTDRVCFIVGNHHTPSKIDGLDFQIQWEADLLENLEYMDVSKDKDILKRYIEDNFKTARGLEIAYLRFGF
jgi:urease accessory protein UreE